MSPRHLTTEQVERITVEATLGKEPTLTSKEELAFRKEVERDISKIKAKGGQVEIESDNP